MVCATSCALTCSWVYKHSSIGIKHFNKGQLSLGIESISCSLILSELSDLFDLKGPSCPEKAVCCIAKPPNLLGPNLHSLNVFRERISSPFFRVERELHNRKQALAVCAYFSSFCSCCIWVFCRLSWLFVCSITDFTYVCIKAKKELLKIRI